jgi:DNA-binding CsgD family transcriptional regulator
LRIDPSSMVEPTLPAFGLERASMQALVATIRHSSYLRMVPIVTSFNHRDLSGALAVLSEAGRERSDELAFGRAVIEQLLRLIPSDHAGYFEYDFASGVVHSVEVPVVPVAVPRATVEALCGWMPLHDQTLCRSTVPLRTSDRITSRQLKRNPFYATVLRPEGIEHELKVWLPAPPRTAYGFFFERGAGRRDFDERECALLALLRPHLAAIRARRRDDGCCNLTDRETEVLRLVARGLTNGEIAERLVISSGTVRTHLEHTFDKLDVHTRTGAVARAFG